MKRLFNHNIYNNYVRQEKKEPDIKSRGSLADRMMKCPGCERELVEEVLISADRVCPFCHHHLPMKAMERIEQTFDEDSFVELNSDMTSVNIFDFPGYDEKLEKYTKSSKLNEAVVTGYGTITGHPVVAAIMDSHFMMGSMGAVVGEKIVLAAEYAVENGLPYIIFCASGGARMQEGIISLEQMTRTSIALNRLGKKDLLYISVLTHPTTGGVTASFAMLGDIIIAEPGALIAFTGPRVIEQTIRQKLPEGFQRSEFILEHGFADMIVSRDEMPSTLGKILSIHG